MMLKSGWIFFNRIYSFFMVKSFFTAKADIYTVIESIWNDMPRNDS